MSGLEKSLALLFDAERTARKLHDDLVTGSVRGSEATERARSRAELVGAIREAVTDAIAKNATDEAEAGLRLTRLASLLGDLDGDEVVDLLVDILGSESPEARIGAGEALEALAFDRWKEVATGIERAVGRLPKGSPALTELPFLLAEVAEPGCVKLLGKFLGHADADAVAAAIEALAELGDPAAIPLLAPLEKDARQVQLDEEDAGSERVAIGDLAHEAKELLESVAEELAEENGGGGGKKPGGDSKKRPRA